MPLEGIKKDFPWFQSKTGRKTTYLDSAATTQKPRTVLDTIKLLYEEYNQAVNRSSSESADLFSEMYLGAHVRMADFIGGKDPGEIIFTRNCTDSINIAANSIARSTDKGIALKPGDRIVTTIMEHHSNMVPWQELARVTGAEITYAEMTDEGRIDLDHLKSLIDSRTRLVAFTHASNVLGTINPAKEITDICHERGALTIIDGTQAVPHMPVNVKEIGCDFYAFSGHKMLAPTGTGVLYGKRAMLEQLAPAYYGGGMIRDVTTEGATWNDIPWKFEAGTPDACGAIALGGTDDPASGRHIQGAIDYLNGIGMESVLEHERILTAKALHALGEIEGIRIIGPMDAQDRTGIVSFSLSINGETADCHTMGVLLAQEGMAVRTGGHCAYPLMRRLGVDGTVRVSFYIYNDINDVSRFICALKKTLKSIL